MADDFGGGSFDYSSVPGLMDSGGGSGWDSSAGYSPDMGSGLGFDFSGATTFPTVPSFPDPNLQWSPGDLTGGGYGAPGPYGQGGTYGGVGTGYSPPLTNAPAAQSWYQRLMGGGSANGAGGPGGGAGGGGGLGSLGLLALLASLGGGLGAAMGGGGSTTTKPQLSPTQQNLLGLAQGAYGGASNAAAGMLPQQQAMFNQGSSLMQALASGNFSLPPAIRSAVQQMYQPMIGDINRLAIEDAQRRGFMGGGNGQGTMDLMNGPAGAVAGPQLANLPGQMAKTQLEMAFQLPQNLMAQGQQGFGNQLNLGGSQANMMLGLPYSKTVTDNPSVAQQIQSGANVASAIGQQFPKQQGVGLSGLQYPG